VLQAPFYSLDGQIAVDLPGARAVFTTRSWGDVRETAREIGDRLGVAPVRPHQVHGNHCLEIAAEQPADVAVEVQADAIVTARSGVAAMVMTADCLAIALAGGGVVAAVHAGWRGLDSGVIAAAVTRLQKLAPGEPLTAAIGPAAGVCCYEVGPELHQRFAGFSVGANLDLKAIARSQLEAAGVATIDDVDLCTICSDPALLFSYRRDGAQTGRQALLTWST
jgi:polyphenol oxidase